MRAKFLERCPDFADFQQNGGIYFEGERRYKEDLIQKAQQCISDANLTERQLGEKFLELLWSSNFVGWRASSQLERAGEESRVEVADALGQMLSRLSALQPAA